MRRNDFILIYYTDDGYAPLQSYLCKIHGHAAKAVQVNDQAIPAGGWGTGRDIYGPVTWVKVKAGAAQKILLRFRP